MAKLTSFVLFNLGLPEVIVHGLSPILRKTWSKQILNLKFLSVMTFGAL